MTTTNKEHDTCDVFCFDEEKVNRISSIVENQEFLNVADMFKALSDQTRLKIAFTLTQENELCVCDVANIIGVTNATASHHLRHLRNLRLAKSRKDGKLVFYSLDDPHVTALITMAMTHSQE